VLESFTLLDITGPALSKNTATDFPVDAIEVGVIGRVDVVGHELPSVGIGLDGCAVLVKDIDLLQGKTLGLSNEEVGEDETSEASRTPDEEHLGAEASIARPGLDEVRSGKGDGPVHKPVGGSGECDTLGTDVERVKLSSTTRMRRRLDCDSLCIFSRFVTYLSFE